MSDAMKNGEIEDVLSSIRRLVSQEMPEEASARSSPPPAALDRAVQSEPGSTDKLVLTPALRVVPGDLDTSQSASATGAKATEGVSDAVSRASLERTIAELEEAVSQYHEEWEPDGTESPLAVVGHATAGEEAAAPGPVDPAEADNVRPFVKPPSRLDTRAQAAVEPPAEVFLHDYATAPESDERAAHDDMERLGYGPDAHDEALRELVGQLVREELHGSLGERITRNVRKLVRAEISRALASRDLT